MYLFFCYIKLKNLIFYVVGVRYIQFFFLKQYGFFKESVGFFGFRHFGRRFCALFSYEFESFFETELFFSMRVFVFLASGILEDGSVPFFHMKL